VYEYIEFSDASCYVWSINWVSAEVALVQAAGGARLWEQHSF